MSLEEYKQLSDIGMVWELESSWDIHYPEAVRFYKENGNLDIPASFVTETGVKLGAWYRTMRNKYREGMLDDEEKKNLEDIGMEWESVKNRTWMMYYGLAKEYYDQNGDLAVNLKYSKDGQNLETWLSSNRKSYNSGKLSGERISKLEKLGVLWDKKGDDWKKAYSIAREYQNKFHNLNEFSTTYVFAEYNLGQWLRSQRRSYRKGALSVERKELLSAIGVVFD